MDNSETTKEEIAVLGGGCFWCLEAVFDGMEGVIDVRSGYAGGSRDEPRYREVCAGITGHAEVVEVRFDPEALPFEEVLRIFFTVHDPTTLNRQGNDRGTQYRSIVLPTSKAQEQVAREVVDALTNEGVWDDPIVTRIEPLQRFWPAEPEHHRYFEKHPEQGYCQVVIAPKVQKARSAFAHRFESKGGVT